jgi:CheY-like chemotaxis protein
MNSALPPLPLLLVEDSPDDVFFFHRAIAKSGIPAVAHLAEDGLKAIDYLLHQGEFADPQAFPVPEIIFLDLKLPHLNGFELLEWMRRHAECPSAPVVILSSSNQPEDRERALELGAAVFLTKPPTPEQLADILKNYATLRAR